MDKRPDTLSRRQLGWLLWAAMLSSLVRQAPGAMLPAAGGAAWLSPLLAAPAAALPAWVTARFLRRREPGEGAGELLCRALGPGLGRGLSLLTGGWLLFCAGFLLRSGADRFVAAVYPESPDWLFAGAMLLLCLPALWGRVGVLGRCAAAAAPALAGMLALVCVLTLPELDLSELELPGPDALLRAGLGALPLLGTLSSGVFFAFLAGPLERGGAGRAFLVPLLALSGLSLLLTVTVTGTFGPSLAGQMDYPFFVMIRNVQLLHLLERVEALAAGMWVVSDFLLVSSVLHMAAAALTTGFRGPGRERPFWLTALCALLAALAAVLCAPDAFALQALGRQVVPGVNLCFAFGVFPAALLIGRLRRKL